MHLTIRTKVAASFERVKNGFDQQLFTKLNPPFPPVKLIQFDGSKKGDFVTLQLNFIFFKQLWKSEIIEENNVGQQFYFVDKGIKLPFFLKYWRHKHIVNNLNNGSQIVDDIHFKTPFILFDFLMYPFLWSQFIYRKPIYRKYFK
jgi:ligand-binding SRPBCC domain-containing protein